MAVNQSINVTKNTMVKKIVVKQVTADEMICIVAIVVHKLH